MTIHVKQPLSAGLDAQPDAGTLVYGLRVRRSAVNWGWWQAVATSMVPALKGLPGGAGLGKASGVSEPGVLLPYCTSLTGAVKLQSCLRLVGWQSEIVDVTREGKPKGLGQEQAAKERSSPVFLSTEQAVKVAREVESVGSVRGLLRRGALVLLTALTVVAVKHPQAFWHLWKLLRELLGRG